MEGIMGRHCHCPDTSQSLLLMAAPPELRLSFLCHAFVFLLIYCRSTSSLFYSLACCLCC